MVQYEAIGWDMYDPRMTLKATVATGVTVHLGYCCRINSSGEIVVDLSGGGTEERVHGCALKAASAGDELVLITHGRLKVVDTQIMGDLVYGQQEANGSCPNTNAAGKQVGFAIEADLVFVHIDTTSAAEA